MMRQQTRKGTQGLEEVDTYDLLDKLKPEKQRPCRRGTKPVGRVCCRNDQVVEVLFDDRIGVAVSRARDFIHGMPQREAEVKQATAEVLRTARGLQQKQQQRKTY